MSTRTKLRAVPLTPAESDLLAEHELTISQGLKAFIAVGLALIAIRDGKLHRATHKTFEDYCRERWSIGKSRAYQLIEASEIASEMSTTGGHEIENERQARALAMVPPHLRQEVLERLRDADEPLTEQAVTKAVNTLLEDKRREAKERDEAGAEEEEEPDCEEEAEEQESEAERTIKRAAGKCAKERAYLARSMEHGRLCMKDVAKLIADDFATAEARQAWRDFADRMDAALDRGRRLANEAEREAAA